MLSRYVGTKFRHFMMFIFTKFLLIDFLSNENFYFRLKIFLWLEDLTEKIYLDISMEKHVSNFLNCSLS